jgi:CopG family transcriptional regulator / antitoxin EndoAI
MRTITENISFKDELLADIDRAAKAERRSRSELLREAARQYLARQRRWDCIFAIADHLNVDRPLTEDDVLGEITRYRARKRRLDACASCHTRYQGAYLGDPFWRKAAAGIAVGHRRGHRGLPVTLHAPGTARSLGTPQIQAPFACGVHNCRATATKPENGLSAKGGSGHRGRS